MTKDEALKLARDALKNLPGFWAGVEDAIDACDEALSQLEQEPVGFDAWLAKQHGDHEGVGFLQALRIAYVAGQHSTANTPHFKLMTGGLEIKVKRELFRFHSKQDWINKGKSCYANVGVRRGYYITLDAAWHVMHIGKCFKDAAYPVICYELQTNWRENHGIKK